MNLKQWLSSIFLLLCLWNAPLIVKGQEERQFDKEKMEAYSDDPDLQYDQDYHRTDSFLSLALAWVFSKLAPIIGGPSLQWILPILFRVFLIAGIIFSIVLILRLKYGSVWAKKSKEFKYEAVHTLAGDKQDYEKLLEESLQTNQHKLTVRYLFLCSLGTLSNQKLITLASWKAPLDYLTEIPKEKQNIFKHITSLFESTWYGDYVPSEEAVHQGMQWYRQLSNA